MNTFITLLSTTFGRATLSAAQDAGESAKRFDYDHAGPLNIQQAGPALHRGNVTIEDITYAGAEGGKVPAPPTWPRRERNCSRPYSGVTG